MQHLFTGLFALAVSCWLVACESGPSASTTSTRALTAPSPGAPPAAPASATAPAPDRRQPDYAGTYAVQDTAICPLSITVTRQGSGYSFSCVNGQTVQGTVEVSQEASGTYFTFVGLKGQEPEEDISAIWQDSLLLIQNSGNSMNEYTRFGNCDAKYLELHRQ